MKVLAICAIAVLSITSAKAQFATGADVVSSYVWRGVTQGTKAGTPNIQPFAAYTVGGFTIGSWASTSFTGDVKEVDLYATYAFSPAFALTLTDYNYNLGAQPNYFDYTKTTGHVFEATLAYTGSEKFPLSATVNTMFAGADKTTAGDQAFSTYAELGYQLTPLAKVFIGGLATSGTGYTDLSSSIVKAGITNVGLKVSKSIAITDKFSLPVYGIVGANPSSKTAFFVAGVTL